MTEAHLKWKKGLSKTRRGLFKRVSSIFKRNERVGESELESLEEILIEGDVGVDTALKIVDEVREALIANKNYSEQDIKQLLKKEMIDILAHCRERKEIDKDIKPYVIMVVGVNGTGKTTIIGKLANKFKQEGKSVLVGCSDTFRAAAAEQLSVWCRRAGADLIKQGAGADPASVAYDSIDAAIARDVDILIIDTAGRLQNKKGLMEELKKIHRVVGRRMESAPHEVLLVLDATTGQNGIMQAKIFAEVAGVTDIALTKLDGTARGGIVLAIHKNLQIPVKWVGIGESIEDIVRFDNEDFVDNLLQED